MVFVHETLNTVRALECVRVSRVTGIMSADIQSATPVDIHVDVPGRGSFAALQVGDLSGPQDAGKKTPVVFLLHGAAMSAASWLVCARHVHRTVNELNHLPGVLLVALDLRGHGLTRTSADNKMDCATLTSDVVAFIIEYFAQLHHLSQLPSFFIVGHSLGGAIAAAVANDPQMKSHIAGLVMVDIVEDTAISGLQHMPAFIAKRPLSFATPDDAAKWFVAEGGFRNLAGIQQSITRCLVHDPVNPSSWAWRTDLAATSPHWQGWFTGMNANFVNVPCPKVLIIAGTDRLDKALTTAHMQGKFQLEVIRDAGHYVHEDQPVAVAEKLARFVVRVDKLTRTLPPPAKK